MGFSPQRRDKFGGITDCSIPETWAVAPVCSHMTSSKLEMYVPLKVLDLVAVRVVC